MSEMSEMSEINVRKLPNTLFQYFAKLMAPKVQMKFYISAVFKGN
jgi:hypothetical protein